MLADLKIGHYKTQENPRTDPFLRQGKRKVGRYKPKRNIARLPPEGGGQ
jgi:hypothetical protein